MPIDPSLLAILCCPVSKSPLETLSQAQLNELNQLVAAKELMFVDGRTVMDKFSDGLICQNAKIIYRIVESIPVLLPDEGIGTTQLSNFPLRNK